MEFPILSSSVLVLCVVLCITVCIPTLTDLLCSTVVLSCTPLQSLHAYGNLSLHSTLYTVQYCTRAPDRCRGQMYAPLALRRLLDILSKAAFRIALRRYKHYNALSPPF